jgi:hypothetical protein
MNEQDERCCGSGVCIINATGECWCGQVWNGTKMVAAGLAPIGNNPDVGAADQQKKP